MAKRNAYLDKLRSQAAQKEAYRARTHVEIDTIALLMAAHDVLEVGPGRASKLLNSFLAYKTEIAEEILKEYREDQSKHKEIVMTWRDLAARLKEILGPEGWDEYRELFPVLSEYW